MWLGGRVKRIIQLVASLLSMRYSRMTVWIE